MCGIVGIIGRKARVSPALLEKATDSLAHRGPDDGGTIILHDAAEEDIEIGLGNRRLAILDLSPSGHQPMCDPETGNWIVYNGEVYNFREIRDKLEREGLRFRSNCDTEVILKAYGCWGDSCLGELRGMFSFAIWDADRHRLFIARDPMGIKPLYYYQSDNYFVFSSEVRTLLGTGLVPRRIDRAGLVNYLAFGSFYDPNTMVEGVSALAAGHFLTWERGGITLSRYFDLSDVAMIPGSTLTSDGKGRELLEDDVAELLEESVKIQLVSDVPVGVFLSGGIDSSCIVGLLSRSGIRPSTFSIVFRESEYSEAEYSRAVAQEFRTDHHEITVSQDDLQAAIGPALYAMDLPTIDGINTYFVSEQARAAGVKVALSGLGGDELFAGYDSFQSVPRMERINRGVKPIPSALRRPLANWFAHVAPQNDRNRKLAALSEGGERIIHPYFLSRMLFTPEWQAGLFHDKEIDCSTLERAERPLVDNLAASANLDPVNRVSYLELRSYMLNTLLRDADSMSMAHGLELRVPFIDHKLVRKVLALPGDWKLKPGFPKPLLLGALRGELPSKIIHRQKLGFTFPFEHWLRGAMRASLEPAFARFEDGPLAQTMNGVAVRRVWKDFLEGKTSWSRPWAIYVLQEWCERNSLRC